MTAISLLSLFLLVGIVSNIIFLPVSFGDLLKTPRVRRALTNNYKDLNPFMKILCVLTLVFIILFPYSLLITHLDKGPIDRMLNLSETRMLRIISVESDRGIWSPYKYALIARVWSSQPPTRVELAALEVLKDLGRSEESIKVCQHTREIDEDLRWWATCDACTTDILNSVCGGEDDHKAN